MDWSTQTLSALAIVALVTLAGCSALVTEDPEAIAEQVQQRHDRIDDLHGVQTTSIEGAAVSSNTTIEVWQRPPDQARQEVLAASNAGTEGDVTVSNGETTLHYDSDANEVTRMNLSGDLSANKPVGESTIERLLERFDVERVGSDTVADRDTHVLELNSTAGDGLAEYEDATVWVDSEYWYPLKYEVTMTVSNETTTVTTAYEEIAFNEGVPDERFTFEAPEDAEITTQTGPETTDVDDLAGADDATDFDVGEPAIPDRFDLESAQVVESSNDTSVIANYRGDGGMLTYSASESGHQPDGETVQIGDSEGVVLGTDDFTSVQVTCDGVVHGLSSDVADEDELVDALAAMACT